MPEPDLALWDKRGLIALAISVPVVETSVLAILERSDAIAFGPQVTAVAPFAVLHDLRWLAVYHPSWLWFGLGLVLLVGVRGALFAATIRFAWPYERARPAWRLLLRNSTGYTFWTAVVMAPWVALLFGLAVVPLSWLFFGAVPVIVIISMIVHRGVVVGQWWRWPSLRSAGWVAASFIVMSAAGAVAVLAPFWLAVLAAGAAGLFNAWAWHSLLQDVVGRADVRPKRRLVPLAVTVLVATIIGVAAVVFRPAPMTAPTEQPPPRGAVPVLVARGFGSSWDGVADDLLGAPYREVRFSYRGLDRTGSPLPYDASATKQGLSELVRLFADQVQTWADESGRDVQLVAVSEGALVAQLYLTVVDDPPVEDVVFLSPLLRPAQVYYPPPDEDGWGVAGGVGLNAMTGLISVISPFEFGAYTPLARSILDHGPALRTLPTCDVASVPASIVLPLASAVATPPDVQSELPIYIVGAQHAGILEEDAPNPVVLALLAGVEPPGAGRWSGVNRVGRAAAAAWQVPRLPVDYPVAWRVDEDGPGPAGLLPCDVAAARVRTWLGDLDLP